MTREKTPQVLWRTMPNLYVYTYHLCEYRHVHYTSSYNVYIYMYIIHIYISSYHPKRCRRVRYREAEPFGPSGRSPRTESPSFSNSSPGRRCFSCQTCWLAEARRARWGWLSELAREWRSWGRWRSLIVCVWWCVLMKSALFSDDDDDDDNYSVMMIIILINICLFILCIYVYIYIYIQMMMMIMMTIMMTIMVGRMGWDGMGWCYDDMILWDPQMDG